MELFDEYMAEREGATVLRNEDGFLSFRIEGDECLILNFYVCPQKRRQLSSFCLLEDLLDRVRLSKCRWLSACVFIYTRNSTESLKAILAFGLKAVKAENGCITFIKEFKDG